MSVLAPLYALAALAVAVPLVLHLIRRRPQTRMPFSSLIFLAPSPPRLTRRSRLDHLLLLLLRGLALLLLAAAFSRPFVRSAALLNLEAPSRRMVLAVDTSASMRRPGLWLRTREQVRSVLDDVRPTDQVALLFFDDAPRPGVSFQQWQETDPGQRRSLIERALADASPSWRDTDLGSLLVRAADLLQTAADTQTTDDALPPQIVLITDLQRGS
jgi:hypothetical protein